MYINEAIERADKLLENEYSLEEKYHWCDVVGAELWELRKDYRKARLERWADNLFLLPEDCDYTRIEKLVCAGQEIPKRDMRTNGLHLHEVRGHCCISAESGCRAARYLFGRASERLPAEIEVIYKPSYRPIRRIILQNERVTITAGASNETGDMITMEHDAPFIAGDVIKVAKGSIEAEAAVLIRNSIPSDGEAFDGELPTMKYALECGKGELSEIGSGTQTVTLSRVITEKTVCVPPFDEMYIDYICAQISYYQRKHDIYQQHIARYNERKAEYAKHLKETEAENDHTVFRNWWNL